MRVESLGTIIEEVVSARTREEKVAILRKHDHPGLRRILQLAFDERVNWLLPKGVPLYKPNPMFDCEGQLYAELRRIYLFLEGGNVNLEPERRETLFIQLLETVTPADAKLLLDVQNKILPTKLDRNIVEEVFPGILPAVVVIAANTQQDYCPPVQTVVPTIKEERYKTVSEKLKAKWADPVWRAEIIEKQNAGRRKKEEKETNNV